MNRMLSLCAAALALLGIEFPLLNGLLAGFATIVPFLGAILSVIPPALIGYAKSGDILIIPKVCALYFLINVVIEGNVIKPLVTADWWEKTLDLAGALAATVPMYRLRFDRSGAIVELLRRL